MRRIFSGTFRWSCRLLLLLVILLLGPLLAVTSGAVEINSNWRTASRDSVKLAPNPRKTPEAVLQVYAARAFSWRAAFADHTWLAIKEKNARRYTIYQVLGWRAWRNQSAVDIHHGQPDRKWYGQTPRLLAELRGEQANTAIKEVKKAVKAYPYKNRYHAWPGPNSNTFIAHLLRRSPSIQVELPPTAIGKDFLIDELVSATPSNTGYQFSLMGIAGVTLAVKEGLEFNLLGLVIGLRFQNPALKIPGFGLVG